LKKKSLTFDDNTPARDPGKEKNHRFGELCQKALFVFLISCSSPTEMAKMCLRTILKLNDFICTSFNYFSIENV